MAETGTQHARFDPERFQRQIAASDLARRYLLGLFIIGYLGTLIGQLAATMIPFGLMTAAVAGWLIATYISARTARLVQHAAQLTSAHAPAPQTESALGEALSRFTLYRTVRILVYHHLAVLRHRQGRFEESSAICSALLSLDDTGMARSLRSTLLMIFAEDRLQLGDLAGAHAAIVNLYNQKLPLVESLQHLMLQMRYEAACGYDDHLLWNLRKKVELLELMPPPACAMCHRLLADAAERRGTKELADHLRRRADLLADPDEAVEMAIDTSDAMPSPHPST